MVKAIRRMGALACVLAVLVLTMAGCGDQSSSNRKDRDKDEDDDRDPITTVATEPTDSTAPSNATPEVITPERVDLSQYSNLPASVSQVYKEASGTDYVVHLTASGYRGMELVCKVSADGVVKSAQCTRSAETNSVEQTYGDNFVGKDWAGVETVDTVANSTLTTAGYKKAIKQAIYTALVLGGKEMDISQYQLPATVTKVYSSSNGYILCLTVDGYRSGMNILCGVTTDGKITDAQCLSSNETTGTEKAYGNNFAGKDLAGVEAVDTVSSATLTTIAYKQAMKDAIYAALILSGAEVYLRTEEEKAQDAFESHFVNDPIISTCSLDGLNTNITAAKKTQLGNYVIDVNGLGYGYFGDVEHYIPGQNVPIKIRVYLSADGMIIDCITLSHKETRGYGAACGAEAYYGQFDGKTADNYTAADGIAGATITTNGYMNAIKRCFEAVAILEGGAQS